MSTAIQDERRHAARLRGLAKARRARARNTARRRREEDRARVVFQRWLQRERAAYALHAVSPDDAQLLRRWQKVLREMPALYGRRDAA